MTALIARLPLEPLSMSALQSGSRRHSARLQKQDDALQHTTNGAHPVNASIANKKRKIQYDEEDDGFSFSRVKNKKAKAAAPIPEPIAEAPTEHVVAKSKASPKSKQRPREDAQKVPVEDVAQDQPTKKRRNRMSFSTPARKQPLPVRRSKRLSSEAQDDRGSPQPHPVDDAVRPVKVRSTRPEKQKPAQALPQPQAEVPPAPASPKYDHSATKIALPFADTPVISRNKAMRDGKSTKGERRSSLGLRGRRASSLIDTGNSNAVPHTEVQIPDFYRHIEPDLIEPRRLRQLLTWCATRAMHPKPQGTTFEDASAKSAARVIEEELLKDLANKSELSDWFSREDNAPPAQSLPERPNPKNVQNTAKIAELEEQIEKLKRQKVSLESLLKPPAIADVQPPDIKPDAADIDLELLGESDAAHVTELQSSTTFTSDISERLNSLMANIGPAVDSFAGGVHAIAQYRIAADNVASRVLSICADKLDKREKEGQRRAQSTEQERSPGDDLSTVLRGLSRADR